MSDPKSNDSVEEAKKLDGQDSLVKENINNQNEKKSE